jgi:hypothetical protein
VNVSSGSERQREAPSLTRSERNSKCSAPRRRIAGAKRLPNVERPLARKKSVIVDGEESPIGRVLDVGGSRKPLAAYPAAASKTA